MGSAIPPKGLLRNAAPPAVIFLLSARLLPASPRRESNERVEAELTDGATWAEMTRTTDATDVADVPLAAAHAGARALAAANGRGRVRMSPPARARISPCRNPF